MKNASHGNLPVGPSDLLTAAEVGSRLRLPLSTVYHLAKTGQLPAVQLGRSWRFPAAGIERLTAGVRPYAVLVVDDDAVTRSLVSGGLEPCGCRVSEAESVEAALKCCQRQRFDALFIDMKMPGRDGTELIRELLGEYSLNQMVLITAHPDVDQARELLELGPITLLRKPLSVGQLTDCVRRIVASGLVSALPQADALSHRAEASADPVLGPQTTSPNPPLSDEPTRHRGGQLPQQDLYPTKTTK